jgi:hypothetical protein
MIFHTLAARVAELTTEIKRANSDLEDLGPEVGVPTKAMTDLVSNLNKLINEAEILQDNAKRCFKNQTR